ncbi:MAG TPA: ATPase [Balneola sp.]|nr:ATPase [Balneola sp.]MAO77154.1 ATPase [Balneola sp.]MBF63397.1 ATPase [Balneola sp.]HAH50374.1 ATPase [Balneola sp.]HBZ37272.1 ATPase [Balneola sp.]
MKKIYSLLNKEFKKKAIILLVLLFFGIGLEILGIGLILPILTILSSKDIISDFPVLNPVFDFLGNPSQATITYGALLILVMVYITKGAYLVYLAWKQTSFSFSLSEELSSKLLKGYMSKPFQFHLNRNSADLIQYITNEISQLTGATTNTLLLITEGAAIAGIILLLIVVEPVGALSVLLLFTIMGLIFYKATRKKLLGWGKERQYNDTFRIQYLLQSFGGIKDILLLGKAKFFAEKFEHHNRISFNLNTKYTTLQSVPRLWFEVIGVISLVLLIFVQLSKGLELASIIPTLAVFVAAAFRIIPSLNRIMASVQTIKYAGHSIDIIHNEFKDLEIDLTAEETSKLTFKNEIELKNIKFKYQGADENTLDLSLKIKAGAMVGFVGESGAGKSTVVDVILGLLKPDSGAVYVDGVDIENQKRKWQNQIGYVPQSIYFTDDTLRNNIAFGLKDDQINEEQVSNALKMAQLEKFVASLPDGLDTVIGENGVRISGGQRQRIGIARALYNNPAVLVLDEATSALDNKTEDGIMNAINSLHGSKTIIVIAHRLRTVEQCDHLFLLEKGKVKEENPNLSELTEKSVE